MKNILTCLLIALIGILTHNTVFATCGDRWTATSAESDSYWCTAGGSSITKVLHWRIFWLDGSTRDVDITDYGRLGPYANQCSPSCWPRFDTPYSTMTAPRPTGI